MTAPMTVAFVTSSLQVGGAERMLSQIILRLDRRRFAPRVVCLYDAGVIGEELKSQGIPVISGMMRHRWDARVLWRLTRWLRRERVRALYTINQPLVQWWVTLCECLVRAPLYVTAIHSTGKMRRIKRLASINRLTLSRVDRVIALSETHRRYLIDAEKIAPERLVVIPNGIDPAPFAQGPSTEEAKRQLGITPQTPVVGIVATLRPEKAHDTFLEAVRLLHQRYPMARFLIIGDGPERSRLETQAHRLKLNGALQWLGWRHDVARLLSAMDVGVLSSSTETAPLAVLEYMAAGKPVVATRVGSVAELVEEGVTGFLVPPRQPEQLAERIARLLEQPSMAQRLGAAGRQRVSERYSIARTVQLTEELLEHARAAHVKGIP